MPHLRTAAATPLCLTTALALAGCASGTTPRPPGAPAAAAELAFAQSADEVDAYDFVELTATAALPAAGNPFADVVFAGQFRRSGGSPVRVEGFCDSPDGRVFRIRFLPTQPGEHSFAVTWTDGTRIHTHQGRFHARDGRRRGLVRIDREHPFHFVWEGTGEHYFWSSTTTYGIVGWDDETMLRSVDRLAALGVNRIRATLLWRVESGREWFENVFPTAKYTMLLAPWVAERPQDRANPGFDVTRFNVAHWQKYERLLRRARDKDMIVSVIFYTDGARKGTDPFGKANMGGPEEERYYRYAIARLAAYSNVMWDVTNEYHLFRDEPWVEKMGTLVKDWDPYDHLTSVHGHGKFHFRKSRWADFAMYQSWDESGGHDFLLAHRAEQKKAGRPMPQVNEEYGYEDHYPKWGGNRKAPARSADNRRRLAWGMYMAGGYQTTGERADSGTGFGPDTGGGWINGRGGDDMVMLRGYRQIATFFAAFPWWRTEPRDELAQVAGAGPNRAEPKSGAAYVLAEPGRVYAVYLPGGGEATLKLEPGAYRVRRYHPRAGTFEELAAAEGPTWTAPATPDQDDWALLLERK